MQKYILLLAYILSTSAPAYALTETTEFGIKDSMPKPPTVTLKMQNDTARSVFAQELYSVVVQAAQPTDSISIYMSQYEFRFSPNQDWLPDPYLNPNETAPSRFFGRDSFNFIINILYYLCKDTTRIHLLDGNQYRMVEIRCSVDASINGVLDTAYYSTIDTFYLPPASIRDWESYAYLLDHPNEIPLLCFSQGGGCMRESYRPNFEYLNINYPETLIGQTAKYNLFFLDFPLSITPLDTVHLNLGRSIYLELSQSKSAIVRAGMLSYYYQYYRWH